MTPDARNLETVRAFSGHRFEEAFDHITPDTQWRLVGQTTLTGRDAIIATCRGTLEDIADVDTTWLRFVTTGGGDVVAVDAVGRYEGAEGATIVSSCDVYEFAGTDIRAITSYAVELDRYDS